MSKPQNPETNSNPAFADHFSKVAARYADFRPHYPAALFDYLCTLVPRSATVWDCACGNGQATSDLAARFFKVFGTDASDEQVASASPSTNVEYRVALAEQSGLPDGSVQLLTIAQALHYLADFVARWTSLSWHTTLPLCEPCGIWHKMQPDWALACQIRGSLY
jgi:trans-aconitate methyltransferase